ncbi:MAG: aminoacrylate hydrolase [Sphingomonadales bacterium]|jgi:aminoacrylate hydrolase|nr:aminoacrylate hydrolase [Sphingomonadales bacterium]
MPLAGGLWYEWHGPEEGAVVILSPGLGGSAHYWAPNLPALEERYRLLLYDHRGTGRSDRELPDASVEAMADDILALMDSLAIARASLIGHAAGGVAGLALALKAPDRLDGVVAVNAWVRPDRHFLRCFEIRLALLRDSGVEAYLRAQPLFLYPANWISDNLDRLDEEAAHQLASFPGRDTVERRIAALAAFDIGDRIGDFRVPILALSARDDMLVPSHCIDAFYDIVGASAGVMGVGGHACNVTEPEQFALFVRNFLDHQIYPAE